ALLEQPRGAFREHAGLIPRGPAGERARGDDARPGPVRAVSRQRVRRVLLLRRAREVPVPDDVMHRPQVPGVIFHARDPLVLVEGILNDVAAVLVAALRLELEAALGLE